MLKREIDPRTFVNLSDLAPMAVVAIRAPNGWRLGLWSNRADSGAAVLLEVHHVDGQPQHFETLDEVHAYLSGMEIDDFQIIPHG